MTERGADCAPFFRYEMQKSYNFWRESAENDRKIGRTGRNQRRNESFFQFGAENSQNGNFRRTQNGAEREAARPHPAKVGQASNTNGDSMIQERQQTNRATETESDSITKEKPIAQHYKQAKHSLTLSDAFLSVFCASAYRE